MHFSLSQLLSDLNISLSEPLALSRQASHPSALTEREKRAEGRIVWRCHPFLHCFSLNWNTDVVPVLIRKLYSRQLGPRKNNTRENLRGVSLCLRILTPMMSSNPNGHFPNADMFGLCVGHSLSHTCCVCVRVGARVLVCAHVTVKTALALVIKAESERGNPCKWPLNLQLTLWLVKARWGAVSILGWKGVRRPTIVTFYSILFII